MRSRLILLGVTLFTTFVGDSCTAPNEQSFVILRASPITAMGSGLTCTISDTNFVTEGILDLGLVGQEGLGYVLCPIVQNNLPSNSAMNKMVEAANILVTE